MGSGCYTPKVSQSQQVLLDETINEDSYMAARDLYQQQKSKEIAYSSLHANMNDYK